jgi:hypothetical protein
MFILRYCVGHDLKAMRVLRLLSYKYDELVIVGKGFVSGHAALKVLVAQIIRS